MIHSSILDNDLYKITMQQAICTLYPRAKVKYAFINRGGTRFPDGFGDLLRQEIGEWPGMVRLSSREKTFLKESCPFLTPVYLDFLEGYRYDANEVAVTQQGGDLSVSISGPWYRTVLWEIPIMAAISELYFKMTEPERYEAVRTSGHEAIVSKARRLESIGAKFADFGTRRRYSIAVHRTVVGAMKSYASRSFVGTSNVRLAMTENLKPIGTQAHEWFMYHGARYGYREANHLGLKRWADVFHGSLGIALSDTFTSKAFFPAFDMKYAKLFDGVRQDSGDPVGFAEAAISHYEKLGIDPASKTIVFSDGLDADKVEAIHGTCDGRIRGSYGIGTNLTNDVGATPLNIVVKLAGVWDDAEGWVPAVKLSDDRGKHTGDEAAVTLCKNILALD